LCCHLSLVAIESSNEAFNIPVAVTGVLNLKRPNFEKVTKEIAGLSGSETPWGDELWRKESLPYSGAVSLGTTDPE
jgi:hypothetical protein